MEGGRQGGRDREGRERQTDRQTNRDRQSERDCTLTFLHFKFVTASVAVLPQALGASSGGGVEPVGCGEADHVEQEADVQARHTELVQRLAHRPQSHGCLGTTVTSNLTSGERPGWLNERRTTIETTVKSNLTSGERLWWLKERRTTTDSKRRFSWLVLGL